MRGKYTDWLLTILTILLILLIFVITPLQAQGVLAIQVFAIAGLLVIIVGALVISTSVPVLLFVGGINRKCRRSFSFGYITLGLTTYTCSPALGS